MKTVTTIKNDLKNSQDTIAAIATPTGRGGVGIIRVSGKKVKEITQGILHTTPKTRYAYFGCFYDQNNEVIDQGLALLFKTPNSFTGEDILELHGHGGAVVLDRLLKSVLSFGARLARPGEFSERAFLNNKIDLAQAESIADLIDSSTEKAAKSAIKSLQGDFSKRINNLINSIIHLRKYVEGAIDFTEEEIDFLNQKEIVEQMNQIELDLSQIKFSAKQGAILKEGMTVVIAGKPNAGKSSLLNCLSGRDTAIVTDIAGTTRDVLREQIQINGVPLHIIDTAGLQESEDVIEQEGIKRALNEIENADEVLLIVDGTVEKNIDMDSLIQELFPENIHKKSLTLIINKIDLTREKPGIEKKNNHTFIYLSAKTGEGVDLLKHHLLEKIGFHEQSESLFIARRRHLDAINRSFELLISARKQLLENRAFELFAEDLRQAQNALSEITGEFTTDDLLSEIFSSFCVGK